MKRSHQPFRRLISRRTSVSTLELEDLPALSELERHFLEPKRSGRCNKAEIRSVDSADNRYGIENEGREPIDSLFEQIVVNYLIKYEPNKKKVRDASYYNRFVKYGLEKGSAALSVSLEKIYGFPLCPEKTDDIRKYNRYSLEIPRLAEDIVCYYENVVGLEDITMLGYFIEHALLIGIILFDKELKHYYGVSLSEYNIKNGKQIHINGRFREKPVDIKKIQIDLRAYENIIGQGIPSQTKRMLLRVAQDEGIDAVNSHLKELYGVSLDEINIATGKQSHAEPFHYYGGTYLSNFDLC